MIIKHMTILIILEDIKKKEKKKKNEKGRPIIAVRKRISKAPRVCQASRGQNSNINGRHSD